MLIFICGVVIACIAEYLFYKNYVKPEEDMQVLALKTELDLKNKQINSLKSQLVSISEENTAS